tara:strand:- start:244 stop:1302 length:1059 start_codon:yes stop_codon:yes gene_type:complete
MTLNGHVVVDVDAHFFEPLHDFSNYLDEPWKSRFSGATRGRFIPGSTGDRWVGGRIMRNVTSYPQKDMTPEEIPGLMKHVGLDKIVLLPNKMLSFGKLSSDEIAVPLANGFIDYMLDKVVDPSEGIYTMLVAPFHDPEESVALIDRVADEKGVVALCLVTAGPEPPLGDRRYDPIYEACNDRNFPVVFHAGGSSVDSFFIRGYRKFLETHTLGFLWNNMAQIVSLVIQGVPEKYPNLDIVFQESGIFWVPLMMHRLDAEYMKRQSEAPLLTKKPSKYMQEFYYGTQPLEEPDNPEYLQQIIDMIGGPERLMYASDYPHWDYDRPSVITNMDFLSDSEQGMILGKTAERIFGI